MERTIALQVEVFSGNLEELEDKVKSMMEISKNPYIGSKKAHP